MTQQGFSAKDMVGARALLAWSQADLAKAANIHPSEVADFELDRREVRPAAIEAMTEAIADAGVRNDDQGLSLIEDPAAPTPFSGGNPDKARAVMIEDAAAAKKGQAKTILRSGMSADAAMLQDVVDSIGSVSNLNISKLAELGPLGHLYLLYRVMSDDAVHPSGKSLQRHMRMADDGESWNGYLVGPEDPERIADTLDRILMIGIALGVAFTQIVGDEENNTRLGEISADYGPFRASQDAAAEVRIARKREAIG